MYEDAKLSKKDIYTAHSDFEGVFRGINYRVLFQLMKVYGFQYSYIATCKELYSASDTYYMTLQWQHHPTPCV
jgi:hypothetical protein